MSARSLSFLVLLWAIAPLAFAAPEPAVKLIVYPTTIMLNGPRDAQRLIVLGESASGQRSDLTRTATVQVPASVRMDDAVVRPLADGKGSLTITVGQVSATIPVEVRGFTQELPVNFSRDIEPILTKASCNSGNCHGAQHGRGGFRLSMFSSDPQFDYEQIVQSAEGRRVVMSAPESSIFLMKPSLQMEHGGGERLKVGSREYERLQQWLAEGATGPTKIDPTVTSLEVFPMARIMRPTESQQLAVTAIWSDGRREDVTPTAQYDSLNDAVAAVSPVGLVQAKKSGETSVMIRFGGQVGIAQVSLPYAQPTAFPDIPTTHFIDAHLVDKWRGLGLVPSPLCKDEEFLRRAFLDTIGTLPTPAEIAAFMVDASPDKRAKLINHLLNRPEFVDFWALKWGDLLRINRSALQEKGMWSFHNWVRAQLRDNVPVDEFVRRIILAEGSTYTEGPANYYRIGNNAEDWAETTAQVFLGVRMQCAKCHHHPFEKWSQDDYYGMAAFFSRLATKNSQEFGLFGRESIIYLKPTGEISHPRKRVVVKPHPLDAAEMDDDFDRRRKLADWLTAKDNSLFARNIVNRFWGYLLGRGLVEPLDDMRATNPACNPALLDALANDFVKHGFDLKHLLRQIMTSRAYQSSSDATPGNEVDALNIHFTRYPTKRLTAEQMADALDDATGTREKYLGLPLGVRAIQLPDSQVRSYLMDVFGRPARQVTCECERTTQPNIAQALHLLNGDFVNKKIAEKTGRIEQLMKAKIKLTPAIQELYLVTLSRLPRPEELAKSQQWVGSAATPREGLQDLLWVLLNSREFMFNH